MVALTCFLMMWIFLGAQNESLKYALQGWLKDRSSGKSLSRTLIYIVEQKSGIVADNEDFHVS